LDRSALACDAAEPGGKLLVRPGNPVATLCIGDGMGLAACLERGWRKGPRATLLRASSSQSNVISE